MAINTTFIIGKPKLSQNSFLFSASPGSSSPESSNNGTTYDAACLVP